MSDAMEPRTDPESRSDLEPGGHHEPPYDPEAHAYGERPWGGQTTWDRPGGAERLVDDSGAIQRIVEQLRAYEADVEHRRQEDRRRADDAARAMDEMRGRLDELEAAEAAVQESAAARAAAMMEAEREALRQRERQFVTGLRTYLADIEQAQQALLSVARQALQSSLEAGDPPRGLPSETGGYGPPGAVAASPNAASSNAASSNPAEPAATGPWAAPELPGGASTWASTGEPGTAPWASTGEPPAAGQPTPAGQPDATGARVGAHPAAASEPPAPMVPEPVPDGMWSPPSGAPVAEVSDPLGRIGGTEDADRTFGPTTDEHRLIDLRNRLDLERMAAGGGWRRFGGRSGGLRRGGSAS